MIVLAVAQDPEGETTHVIWGRGPGETYRQLAELQGFTADGQVVDYTP